MRNTNLTSDFTASVVQDLNTPTMAINSYLNNATNSPNGYQTGGKVVSVIDTNGELGAQLSLTRGYSHPQYRYKDNNGWATWENVLLASDLAFGGITPFAIPANSNVRKIVDLPGMGSSYRLFAYAKGSDWAAVTAVYCNNNQAVLDIRNFATSVVNVSVDYTILRK